MALVDMRDMLRHAYENNYAVGAFDLVSLDFLEAVIEAAEKSRAGIILSIEEPHFAHYDYELMLPAVEAAARRATIPVAIQLDHGRSQQSIADAIRLGCNGVMLDASELDLPANIEATRTVVEMAHGCGVAVVGELGYVAGIEGEGKKLHPGEPELTMPTEAKAYVERTGVDFLAVSIGTTQGRVKGRPKLDFQRLKQIHRLVDIPLEIHGGSGLNEEQYRKLTALGVAKINYYTALSDIAAGVMRKQSKENPRGSFTDLKKGVKEAICDEVQRCLRLWGSAGRAAEILAQCEPWAQVDHVIIRVARQGERSALDWMVAESRSRLETIPGVREVAIGRSLDDTGQLRFFWRIRMVHPDCRTQLVQHSAYRDFLKRLDEFFDRLDVTGDFIEQCVAGFTPILR